MLSIKVNEQDLARAKNLLAHIPKAYNAAVKLALSRTLETMRTEAVKKTTEQYEVKASTVRKTIQLEKSRGIMRSRGPRLKITDYKFKPIRARAKNYTGAVRKSGLKKFPGAFFIKLGAAGKSYPYIRVGKKRWDIKAIFSPAVPQILQNPETLSSIEERAGEVFSQRLNHEVMRALGMFAK